MALSELIIIAILGFIFSLFVLAASAHFLVKSLMHIAKALGISAFVIGLVVLSVVTATPEFLNVLVSSLQGIGELGIGDIIGASIIDLVLVLGVVSLITKSKLTKLQNYTFIFSLFTIGLFVLLAVDNNLSRLDGVIMFAAFLAYQFLIYKQGITLKRRQIPFKKIATAYIIAPLAIFSLIVGSFLMVSTAGFLAVSVGISAGIIGLIFVAIGTSAPELTASITSALKKGQGLALGTMIGSIILNLFFAGGLAAIIAPITFEFSQFQVPILILFLSTLVFTLYVNIRKQSDKYLGAILLGIFAIYIYLTATGVLTIL